MSKKDSINIKLSTFLLVMILIAFILLIIIFLFTKTNRNNNTSYSQNTIINNIVKNDNNLNNNTSNIISSVSYMEIEIIDTESKEGLQYTVPLKIADKNAIEKLCNLINSSKKYTQEELAKNGAYDFLDDAPIVTFYLKNGNKIHVIVSENEFATCINDDYSDKILYKASSNIKSVVYQIYSEFNK